MLYLFNQIFYAEDCLIYMLWDNILYIYSIYIVVYTVSDITL